MTDKLAALYRSPPGDGPPVWRVILRRSNGRYVRDWPAKSRYAAKQLRDREEERHDPSFYVEVRDPSGTILASEEVE